jgi:hypothetical protein
VPGLARRRRGTAGPFRIRSGGCRQDHHYQGRPPDPRPRMRGSWLDEIADTGRAAAVFTPSAPGVTGCSSQWGQCLYR